AVHDERTAAVTPSCLVDGTPANPPANPCIPYAQGSGLLMNQSLLEGHRATVDWGKRDYPNTPGQIVGITHFAKTRNEVDPRTELDPRNRAPAHYEAALPDVTGYLETPGPNGIPNDGDDVVANKYVTDHWQQPNASQDLQDNGQGGANSFTQGCNPIQDFNGA